ncbi:ABC transporter ATP-binding protein [Leucobacter triazinivorans]|uniref:ABC transporter ATP-binding protein n=1 Tax=Leucobacter triazinivorans TaxID=1784719 RepID=A0A4P6KJ94_9MICO|nr:ABC transporter ATP-binding protein [Leucobacter triazinivorans]
MFSVEDVSVSYPAKAGSTTVLEGVRLRVDAGEILTIVGGSGTGKSTLLRLLGGLAAPTGGLVRYRGTEVSGAPEGVVMVFQDYVSSLMPWRTVRENIELGLLSQSLTKEQRRERVERMVDLVKLSHAADRFPWQLSGGMQQRVQIARAMALEPDVLLMDEPFGALDAITRAELQDEIARIQSVQGTSTVFITHDVEEAIYLGDRVLVLGGSPAKVEAEYEVRFARPRDQIATREDEEFVRLRHEVHRALGHPSESEGST